MHTIILFNLVLVQFLPEEEPGRKVEKSEVKATYEEKIKMKEFQVGRIGSGSRETQRHPSPPPPKPNPSLPL
jgi:hypothetical protein